MRRRKFLAFTWIELLIVLAIVGLFYGWLGYMSLDSPEAGRRAVCMNNLSQIAMAMLNYHAAYETFPPAYVADESGKPLYSWRVLILPWLEHKELYEEFRLDEPWDSESNIKLLERMPACYRCPSNREIVSRNCGFTSYVRIVGPGTITDGPTGVNVEEITDGMSQTILVTETLEKISWTAPMDLPVRQLDLGVNSPSGRGMGSNHPGVTIAAFADRSIRPIFVHTKPETLRSLATVSGGETVVEGDN